MSKSILHKDPAFLFYPTDFMGFVMNLDDAETGQFIKLLCLQHIQGHFSENDLMNITGYEPSERLLKKFELDAQGLFFNEWIDALIIKRKAYAESRRKNRKGKKKKREIEDSC
jgi:hypothetical protein